MAKKCPPGKYYCFDEKKCKKIPRGYRIGARGYLAREREDDNETKKNGNGSSNENGNGGNGAGNGNGGSGGNGGGNGGGGMGEAVVYEGSNPRIPRKKGQPAKSKKHSDLYTDEDPKGTIHGLGFKNVAKAKASVSKIRSSSRSHAHKIQAAVAMEQRAREMGKSSEAAVYRKYINSMKKKTKSMKEALEPVGNIAKRLGERMKQNDKVKKPFIQEPGGEKKPVKEGLYNHSDVGLITNAVVELEDGLKTLGVITYDSVDQLMQGISKRNNISPTLLHNQFKAKHLTIPDDWAIRYRMNKRKGIEEAKKMTKKQMKKRDEIADAISTREMNKRYGDKNVKYAIATKLAMKEEETDKYNVSEEGLRAWFGKSSGTTKSGRKVRGWVQVGGKYDGKPCARQPGQKSTPKCVSSSKRRSMSDKERDSAARRKRAADPNQPNKSGAAKPTNVSTDPKKKMKENYFNRNKVIEEKKETPKNVKKIAKELDAAVKMHTSQAKRLRSAGISEGNKGTANLSKSHPEAVKKLERSIEKFAGKRVPGGKMGVKKEEYVNEKKMVKVKLNPKTKIGVKVTDIGPGGKEVVRKDTMNEAKDKKGKGSGSKDACYHKVKSRYSVWPSAYASGALVKCRKVGAANWGNKSKNEGFSPMQVAALEEAGMIDIKEGQKCWKGYEKKGTKMMFGKRYNNCVKKKKTRKEEVELINEIEYDSNLGNKMNQQGRENTAKSQQNQQPKKKTAYRSVEVVTGKNGENIKKGSSQDVSVGSKKEVASRGILGKAKYVMTGEEYAPVIEGVMTLMRKKKEEKKKSKPSVSTYVSQRKSDAGNKAAKIMRDKEQRKYVGFLPANEEKDLTNESKTRLVKNGHTYKVILTWRGKTYMIQMFVPSVSRPTRQQVEKEVQKVYPDAKLMSFLPKDLEPGEPTVMVGENFIERRAEQEKKRQAANKAIQNTRDPEADKKAADARKDPDLKKLDQTQGEEYVIEDDMKGMSVKSGHKRSTKSGAGMTAKGVAAYRRRNPGSKLKTAVTGKVKKGSKDAKRRKSYCARSAGQMKKFPKAAKDPNSRLRQARRRWKC